MRPMLWLGLALAAGGALAVSWLPEDELAAAVQRVEAPARSSPAPRAAAGAESTPVLVNRQAWPSVEGAARGAWNPPPKKLPPPPPPPVPPPPAPPPPFPYQWLGQLQEGGQLRVFLGSPQQTLAITPGDTVDGRWRVEGNEGGRLRLTWLPTGQTVFIGPRGTATSPSDPA